jgi:hypothetical protein
MDHYEFRYLASFMNLLARLSCKPVTNLSGSITAVAQAEYVAQLAGRNVIYVDWQ